MCYYVISNQNEICCLTSSGTCKCHFSKTEIIYDIQWYIIQRILLEKRENTETFIPNNWGTWLKCLTFTAIWMSAGFFWRSVMCFLSFVLFVIFYYYLIINTFCLVLFVIFYYYLIINTCSSVKYSNHHYNEIMRLKKDGFCK